MSDAAEAGLSDGIEAEAAAMRLEQALERIAALAARPVQAAANPVIANLAVANLADGASIDVAVLSGRLDALIAELRGALAG